MAFPRLLAMTLLSQLLLISACAAPLVILPTSNIITEQIYAKQYTLYQQQFNNRYRFKEHRIPRETSTIYAREYGVPRQNLPTLFLMHGFPDSLHLYDLIAPKLALTHHVVAFDFLGWGNSGKPPFHAYNMASLRTDLEIVIRYFNTTSVVLVMHDASGPPAIDWALDNEGMTAGLILLNTFYSPMDELKSPEAIALFSQPSIKRAIVKSGAYVSSLGWRNGFTKQINKFFLNAKLRQQYVPVFTYQSFESRWAFFELNKNLIKEVRARKAKLPAIRRFKKPVRIIFGADDPYLNAGVARHFHQLFPNSQLFLIKNAAHYVQLDQADMVVEQILSADFLNN